MREIPTALSLFGGTRRPSISGRFIDSVNPATGEVIAQFPRCDTEDVDVAVAAAQTAFEHWRQLDPSYRARSILAFADAVERDRERLLSIEVADNGSPRSSLATDIEVGVRYLRYFAGLTLQVRGETVPSGVGHLNFTLREPFGVALRIVPFNHPIMFILARLAPPLLMGNTLILKPSEHTSLSALALADLFAKHFPPGVVSVVTGFGTEVGDALVVHRGIRRIAFIGSLATGLAIQRRAAENTVKSVTLELGGKSPLVVFPDANMDRALDAAVAGLRLNIQGQACGATTRLLLHRNIHDRFIELLSSRLATVRVGNPEDPETEVGAIITSAQLDKILGYIDDARSEGATVVVGGERLTGGSRDRGNFIGPTLLTGVSERSPLAQEEVFGPVVSAIAFSDYDDAVHISNNVRYALTAAVFTENLTLAHSFAQDVKAGYVWINDNQRHYPGTSYGGAGDSGLGREEDLPELESYTQSKNVHIYFGSVPN